MNLNFTATHAKATADSAAGGLGKSLAVGHKARLFSATMFNNHASADRYLQVFDAAALPDDGTAAVMTVKVPAGSTGALDFRGRPMTNGIVVACSTTAATLTITGSDEAQFDVTYS